MTRRSSLSALSALTRAYQRNLKAFARAARSASAKTPVKALVKTLTKTPVKAPAKARSKASPRGAPAPRRQRSSATGKPVLIGDEWLSGVAPGPAGARRYHLFIPAGLALQPGEKCPLLVMLHGCGQTGRELAAVSRMNRLATRERFLVLYPEQERMANAHRCWNWFERRSGKADAEAATLLAAIDQLARRQPIDLARVAVAGLSAGATMAAWMAARYPERFCAVVMHSGAAPGTAESAATAMAAMRGRRKPQLPEPAERPLSGASGAPGAPGESAPVLAPSGSSSSKGTSRLPALLVLHGDADGVVSIANAAAAAALWAQALGARAGATRSVQRGQRHAMRVTEFKAAGRAVVVLREVAGLAHAWSGGAANLPYSDPAGPDASALIWAFVARQFANKAPVGRGRR